MINGKKQNNLYHKFLYNSLIFDIYSENKLRIGRFYTKKLSKIFVFEQKKSSKKAARTPCF